MAEIDACDDAEVQSAGLQKSEGSQRLSSCLQF